MYILTEIRYGKTFFSGLCILCHEGNHILVHKHVHRVYTADLGLYCTCVCLHTCVNFKLSCTIAFLYKTTHHRLSVQ